MEIIITICTDPPLLLFQLNPSCLHCLLSHRAKTYLDHCPRCTDQSLHWCFTEVFKVVIIHLMTILLLLIITITIITIIFLLLLLLVLVQMCLLHSRLPHHYSLRLISSTFMTIMHHCVFALHQHPQQMTDTTNRIIITVTITMVIWMYEEESVAVIICLG